MGRLKTGEKALVAAGLIGLPVFLVIAVVDGRDQPAKPPAVLAASHPAQAAPSNTKPPVSSPARQGAIQRPAADIDQPGDDSTPCVLTYQPTEDGRGTVLRVTLTAAGDLIAHLDGPGGLVRHEKQSGPGQLTFTDQVPLNQVTGAGAVVQDPDGSRHVCAIRPAG